MKIITTSNTKRITTEGDVTQCDVSEINEEERTQLWIRLSRRVLAALRRKIPQHHPDWIERGGWVDVSLMASLGIRLSESDLFGLAEGEGGRGRTYFDWYQDKNKGYN